jgi:hypothetical protein
MACTDPVRLCLDWHVRPHLAHAVLEENGDRVRARCPSCGTRRTLTVSAGKDARLTWNCFQCERPELRGALIAAGVPSRCIPLSRSDERDVLAAVTAAAEQGTPADRAQTLLRVYLIALGYARWPQGAELEKLAGCCGVSRAQAYAARKAGALMTSPGTPST